MLIEAILYGGFGLIFGSFANVLILRHGIGSLGGRSACRSCKRELEWFELVPLLSWIVLRGTCRTCHAKISWQYPLVEALMMLGFISIGLAPVPLMERIIGCAIFILLMAILVYDLRHMIMPDPWVFGVAGLALCSSFSTLILTHASGLPYLMLIAAGPLVALPLFLMWYVSKGAWMGFGDVKFALGMGWLLGTGYGYLALMSAFVIGAIVGVCILLPWGSLMKFAHLFGITRFRTRAAGFTMKSEVPFGPFLILGTCIIWFLILYHHDPAFFLFGGSL
jgi:prepilin signal peptidase PulO-like enzyme (type II secretory pathway)